MAPAEMRRVVQNVCCRCGRPVNIYHPNDSWEIEYACGYGQPASVLGMSQKLGPAYFSSKRWEHQPFFAKDRRGVELR